jgi:hypothetical protein
VGPVFMPLKDLVEFAKASLEPDLGTIVCSNGADLAPEFPNDDLKAALARRGLRPLSVKSRGSPTAAPCRWA